MATETTIGASSAPVFRGERVTLAFTIAPVVDISGWTMVFNLAKAANSTVKLVDDKAVSVVSGPAGTSQVTLTPTELDLKPGTYYWDVWRTDTNEEVVLGYGPFVVSGNAKKPEA